MSTKTHVLILSSFLLLASFSACSGKAPAHVGDSVIRVEGKDGTSVTHIESRQLLSSGKIAGQDSALVQVKATVSKIDYKTRALTLALPEREPLKLTVGPEVRNFDQIKAGDKVSAEYLLSVSFEVRKPTQEELLVQGETVGVATRAKLGEMPAGDFTQGHVEIATVEAIDLVSQTVTLKGDTGPAVQLKAKYPENLAYVKVGDTVVLTTLEALATNVSRVE